MDPLTLLSARSALVKAAGLADLGRRAASTLGTLFERPAVVGERLARSRALGPQHQAELSALKGDYARNMSDWYRHLANPAADPEALASFVTSGPRLAGRVGEAERAAQARHAALQTGAAAGAAGGARYGADRLFGDKMRALFGHGPEGQPS